MKKTIISVFLISLVLIVIFSSTSIKFTKTDSQVNPTVRYLNIQRIDIEKKWHTACYKEIHFAVEYALPDGVSSADLFYFKIWIVRENECFLIASWWRGLGGSSDDLGYPGTYKSLTIENPFSQEIRNHPIDGTRLYFFYRLHVFVVFPIKTGDTILYAGDYENQPLYYEGELPYYGPNETGDYYRTEHLGPSLKSIDITPDPLIYPRNEPWVTAYIHLLDDCDVNNIDVSSISLYRDVPADLDAPTDILDFDQDGLLDLMVNFDSDEVISFFRDTKGVTEGEIIFIIRGTVGVAPFYVCNSAQLVINTPPMISNLQIEGFTNPINIETFSPTFSWIYNDLDGDSQSNYEIEVGGSFGGNDLWDLNDVSGAVTSIVYAGDPLSKDITHYLRVRAKDGREWGDWTYGTFKVKGGECVITSIGSGNACVETDNGILVDLTAIDEWTLPTEGKPNLIFPHGFLSFRITELTFGESVTISIAWPSNVPIGSYYCMYDDSGGEWIQIPIDSDDGDNVITITKQDGGFGDADGLVNGVVEDPGGLGVEATLDDYPSLFNGRTLIPCTGSSVPHGPFNDWAKTSDVLSIVDISIGIITGSTANIASGRLDTELLTWPGLEWKSGYETQDVISAGGPIVSILHHKYNDPSLAAAWWDYNTWEIVTSTGNRYSDPSGKHSYIAIINDGGRLILLSTGYCAEATRDAGIILKNYNLYSHLLQGKACVFIPNDLNGDGDFLDPGELQMLENVS